MINKDRIAKSSADLLNARADIGDLLSVGKEVFLSDKRNALAVRYLLIQAVEAIADICQHLLAKTRGVVCSGYVDCIVKAGENGLIHPQLANKLRRLADLRNALIHRYWVINDEELFEQCNANINDFLNFIEQINSFISNIMG